jgi:hypothetical protein
MFVVVGLGRYLAQLTPGRTVLWCYAIWYAVNVSNHFDSNPRLWLTSLGLSGIIGFALLLSTATSNKVQKTRPDPWVVFRLFLMPFCVSSFAALVKGAGYILIFPPTWKENAAGVACILCFLGLVALLKRTSLGMGRVEAARA